MEQQKIFLYVTYIHPQETAMANGGGQGKIGSVGSETASDV
jgi:hypothetical protein